MHSDSEWWHVSIGASLLLAAGGIWLASPIPLLVAMMPIGFGIYKTLSNSPTIDETTLVCERKVTPAQTYPGQKIKIKLTVKNTGEGLLPDVRVIDGVPDELAVISGSPRAGMTLQRGEQRDIEYTLRARYGDFKFSPVSIKAHDLAPDSSTMGSVSAEGDNRIEATYDPEKYPLPEQTLPVKGAVTANKGDEGLEFHSTRQYQPSDPANRINWRQYARERELSTIEYRAEEAAEILLIVDARPSAGRASEPTAPTGTELCVSLADDLAGTLLADRNRVGMLILGIDESDFDNRESIQNEEPLTWIPPANSSQTRTQMRMLLDAAAATVRPGSKTVEDEDQFNIDPLRIIRQTNPWTQLIFLTPLCDTYPVDLVEQCEATNRTVSVYSPDITSQATPGGRTISAQRSVRLATLQSYGTTVIDWDPTEQPDIAVSRREAASNAGVYSHE